MALSRKTRVSRGDWLGDPANFKEPAYCLDFDVERTGHVTLTVHKHDRVFKMVEVVDNLFVFGVDSFWHIIKRQCAKSGLLFRHFLRVNCNRQEKNIVDVKLVKNGDRDERSSHMYYEGTM